VISSGLFLMCFLHLFVLQQGRLGDCWFLSAVAVLTEASRISDVIVTPEFNEEGIYTVRFCIQVNTSIVLRFNVTYKNCLAT
jgi:hypothetical protein